MEVELMDSETIETLNILRPSVNRNHNETQFTQQDKIGYLISSAEAGLVRDFTQSYKVQKKKKLSKKQIAESNSFVDSEILFEQNDVNCKNKPTINVTIVPRKESFSLVKFPKSHSVKHTKDIASSESIYATKNVYLIVSGRKEQKLYKIKTTGAINTITKTAKDVKKLNDKHYLNMDKKRKKKTNEIQLEEKCSDGKCLCKCKKDNLVQDACAGSSRVRIVGRIELDEDDKYVMKCAATVNGQPVTTDYIKAEKNSILGNLGYNGYDKTTRESQGTQVDIDISGKNFPTIDQNIQCNLNHKMYKKEVDNNKNESKVNTLKGSNSPLVIISVYPKQELNTYTVTETNESSPFRLNMQSYPHDRGNTNEAIRSNRLSMKTDLQNTRVRSPNRIHTSRNTFESDKSEDKKRKITQTTKTFRASRSASPANRTPKTKMQERNKPTMFTENNLLKINANSPNRNYTSNKKQQQVENNLNVVKQNKRKIFNTKKTDFVKQLHANTRSLSRCRDISVNSVKTQTNNNIAQSISKKPVSITNHTGKRNVLNDDPTACETVIRKSYPKSNISKVSVNIDSEKDFYDVIFEKNKFSTDLTVRNTTKESGPQKYFEDNLDNLIDYDTNAGSLENFFPLEELEVMAHHRRSVSQGFNKTNEGFSLAHISRLAVRDSLEIGHRRENGKILKKQTTASKYPHERGNKDDDGEFLAPVKHFTGDNCIIDDPVERDKEIRELLGIDRQRLDKNHFDETLFIFERNESNNEQNSSNCFFSKSLWKKKINKNNGLSKEEKVSSDNEEEFVQIDVVVTKRELVQEKYMNELTGPPIMIRKSTQYEVQEKTSDRDQTPQDMVNLLPSKIEPYSKQKAIQLSRKQYRKVKKSIHKVSGKRQNINPIKLARKSSIVSVGSIKAKHRSTYLIHWNKEVQTEPSLQIMMKSLKNKNPKIKELKDARLHQENNTVLYSIKNTDNNYIKNDELNKFTSSIEIRFTNVEFKKDVASSSFTDIDTFKSLNKVIDKHYSTQTIFRGKKKLHTPNLGTSSLSLVSDEAKSVSEKFLPNSKPKKPFLKRLMSCLAMRSATSEETKLATKKRQEISNLNSSVDTYHISTSLGAIEMGSSLYDTSASFYSNHTIGPVHKAKRGFFSSVRGLLSTLKS